MSQSHVLPRSPIDDGINCVDGHGEQLRQVFHSYALPSHLPHLDDLVTSELAELTIPFDLVASVVRPCSRNEMSWLTAGRRVAGMSDDQPFTDWTDVQVVADYVCSPSDSHACRAGFDDAVAAVVRRPSPDPTAVFWWAVEQKVPEDFFLIHSEGSGGTQRDGGHDITMQPQPFGVAAAKKTSMSFPGASGDSASLRSAHVYHA